MSELLNTKHQHIESLDVAPDGLVALATSSLTGEVWDGRLVVLRCAADAARAEVIASVETEVGNAAVAWAGPGLVASGDDAGNVTVWRFGTGAAGAAADEERLPVAVYSEHDQAVTCVACAPGGARLASGSADGTVRVWACGAAAQAERCLQHKPAEPWLECGVAAAAWLSAELLSTCDEEGKVRLWDLRVPAAVRAVAREGCGSGCLAPLDETSLASGTRAGDVAIYDLRSGSGGRAGQHITSRRVSLGRGAVRCLSARPGGSPLAAAGHADGSLSLVDLSTLAARPVPAAHSDVVSGVGWLPPSDGAHASLLSCGWDKRLVATEVQ